MIVIADTSPINYLVVIQEIRVLPVLYGRIIVPSSVCEELSRPEAPVPVRLWMADLPDWLDVREPAHLPDAELLNSELDAGERDAILLAEELGADRVIIDEIRGRKVAQRRRLNVTGTLGVLKTAADRGFLDLRTAIESLRQTNFRISQEVLDALFGGA